MLLSCVAEKAQIDWHTEDEIKPEAGYKQWAREKTPELHAIKSESRVVCDESVGSICDPRNPIQDESCH